MNDLEDGRRTARRSVYVYRQRIKQVDHEELEVVFAGERGGPGLFQVILGARASGLFQAESAADSDNDSDSVRPLSSLWTEYPINNCLIL